MKSWDDRLNSPRNGIRNFRTSNSSKIIRMAPIWTSFGPKLFSKSSSRRCDRCRQEIVEIGAILAIFEPFEVRKFRMPFFGEFSRSSQDLSESDYDSIKSRDDRLSSPKNGMRIFKSSNGSKIARIAPILTIFGWNRSRQPNLFFQNFSFVSFFRFFFQK